MIDEEFIRMVVEERIAAAVEGKIEPPEKAAAEHAEKILQEMDEGNRSVMEKYIDQLISREADAQVHAYIGGFKDGILLLKALDRLGAKGRNGGS